MLWFWREFLQRLQNPDKEKYDEPVTLVFYAILDSEYDSDNIMNDLDSEDEADVPRGIYEELSNALEESMFLETNTDRDQDEYTVFEKCMLIHTPPVFSVLRIREKNVKA